MSVTVKVKEVLQPVRGSGKLKKSNYQKSGSFPVIDQGNNVIAGFTDREELLIRAPLPIIVFGDHTRALKLVKEPFVRGADGTQLIYPKPTMADPVFFYYALKNLNLSNYHYARHFKFLKEEEVGLPALDDQLKIAEALGAYDDFIENNFKRIRKLEAITCLLYRHYFEISESKDWRELPLSELLVVHRGKSYKSSELSDTKGMPFVNLKCVNRGGGFRKDGLKLFTGSYKDSHSVKKGDLVMAVTDMTQERLIVARAARVPSLEGGKGVISMDMVKLNPKEGYEGDYLYSMLRWSRFANEVKNHANGANVLHLPPARITDYKLNVPPEPLRSEFARKVSPILDLIDALERKNDTLSRARDLLLPRLMSGEIKL